MQNTPVIVRSGVAAYEAGMAAAHKHISDGRIHWINDALRRFRFITEPGALAPRRLLNLQGAFVNGYQARWKAQRTIDRIAAL